MENRFCGFVAFATKELPEDGHTDTPHTDTHTPDTAASPVPFSSLSLSTSWAYPEQAEGSEQSSAGQA